MYGFDENTSESTGAYITITPETAINWDSVRYVSNVKLIAEDDNPYVEIEVKDAEGRIANRRFYKPRIDGSIVKDEAGLTKAKTKFSKIMANLSRRFLGKNYRPAAAASFEEWCRAIIAAMEEANYRQTPIRCVCVYNKAGYITLRGFPPIFEDMSVPKAESQLKLITEGPYAELVTPPVMPEPDADPAEKKSFEEISAEAAVTAAKKDDLPF